jgi:hypothetical protein
MEKPWESPDREEVHGALDGVESKVDTIRGIQRRGEE